MGFTTILFSILAVCFVISTIEAGATGGSCPLASKVYGCSPKCVQSYDCTHGRLCCPNSCNSKSCAEPAPYGGASGGDKYSQNGGSGAYCGNVKCRPGEVCKTNSSTKRQECGRA